MKYQVLWEYRTTITYGFEEGQKEGQVEGMVEWRQHSNILKNLCKGPKSRWAHGKCLEPAGSAMWLKHGENMGCFQDEAGDGNGNHAGMELQLCRRSPQRRWKGNKEGRGIIALGGSWRNQKETKFWLLLGDSKWIFQSCFQHNKNENDPFPLWHSSSKIFAPPISIANNALCLVVSFLVNEINLV